MSDIPKRTKCFFVYKLGERLIAFSEKREAFPGKYKGRVMALYMKQNYDVNELCLQEMVLKKVIEAHEKGKKSVRIV